MPSVASTRVRRSRPGLAAPRRPPVFNVSKAGTTTSPSPRKKLSPSSIKIISQRSPPRKRKFAHVEPSTPSPSCPARKTRRPLARSKLPKTPPARSFTSKPRESSINTARQLLETLSISTPVNTKADKYPGLSVPASEHDLQLLNLPPEVMELVYIHSAFLTAWSIHTAHHGTHTPADLRNLCQDMTRIWGIREVTSCDFQRVLALVNAGAIQTTASTGDPPRIVISNYDHGKICVEIAEARRNSGRTTAMRYFPLRTELKYGTYVAALIRAWNARDPAMDGPRFIESLPLEPIVRASAVALHMSPLLAKGQRRLESIRATMAAPKATPERREDGMTLLDRLRAKELRQLTLRPPPSPRQIARRAALDRVEAIAAVITVLSTSGSTGQQRVSFTLPTVLERLKDTLKTSKIEGENCINVMSKEIAPDWVKMVKIGKTQAVVVDRYARPSDCDMRDRVRKALLK